ncbi:hypothetical protein L1049_009335 [Liquidambar formosana]|uniref:Uncharacterized protein n=1 Tax=Liquidambar formosana TaxID=63359 RepID=A0AAP0S5X2_LIQFO
MERLKLDSKYIEFLVCNKKLVGFHFHSTNDGGRSSTLKENEGRSYLFSFCHLKAIGEIARERLESLMVASSQGFLFLQRDIGGEGMGTKRMPLGVGRKQRQRR